LREKFAHCRKPRKLRKAKQKEKEQSKIACLGLFIPRFENQNIVKAEYQLE